MAAAAAAAVIGGAFAANAASKDRKAARKAQEAQADNNAQNIAFIKAQAAKAEAKAVPLFAQGQEAREKGTQSAIDVFRKSMSQQQGQFTQGNQQAQAALLAGLPQVHNAIMGMPVDLSGLSGIPAQSGGGAAPAGGLAGDFIPDSIPDFNTGVPQVQKQQSGSRVIDNVLTNQDLFRAASQGSIPNISKDDQAFFANHLKNIQGMQGVSANDSSFISDPSGSIQSIMNQAQGTGFNQENRNRLANLITQFQGGR